MKNRNDRRGYTLVELTVVMALIVILTGMIISFTSLTSFRVKQATAATDCMDAFTEYREGVTEGFALIDAASDTPFLVVVDGALLTIRGKDTIGDMDFPPSEHIDSVTVETNGTLLRITVLNDRLSLSESFVIASHCGATFVLGGGE